MKPIIAIDGLLPILEEIGDQEKICVANLLKNRIDFPSAYLTVVGETSSGKSSIINGLLSEPLLPMEATPTNGTVVHIDCSGEKSPQYFVIDKNGNRRKLGYQSFQELCKKPDEECLRLEILVSPRLEHHRKLHVFDTPGFNSVVDEHAEVLTDFLPESDVIVFVVGYRQGFGQVEQELLDMIGEATKADPSIEIVLVVNRAPANLQMQNKRLVEIKKNAFDCLGIEPSCIVVDSVSPEQPEPRVPESKKVWDEISKIVDSPERTSTVKEKLHFAANSLLQEVEMELERLCLELEISPEDRKYILQNVKHLSDAREKCLNRVKEATEDLRVLTRTAARRGVDGIKKTLKQEIEATSKWHDKELCLNWLNGHALQHETRKVCKGIEQIIQERLNSLDKEIEEIANTAVKNIERDTELASDSARKLAANIVRTVLFRASGMVAKSLLSKLGGVGGTAAGTGNLVKMVVKRAGKMFGKTFKRTTYTKIGRFFTKKMIKKLNVGLMVAVEIIATVLETATWQKSTRKNLTKELDKFQEAMLEELEKKTLPEIDKSNKNGVHEIFDDLIDTKKKACELDHEKKSTLERYRILQTKTNELIGSMKGAHS